MKTQDLRKLKANELQTKLVEIEQQQVEAQHSHAAGELVNPRVITANRKTIARIKTLIQQAKQSDKED